MKKLLISALGLGAIVLAGGQANAAIIVLDNFNEGITDSDLGGPAPQSFTETVPAAGAVGGSRAVMHDVTLSDSPNRQSNLFINDDIDSFSLSNESNVNATAGASYGPGLGLELPPTPGQFRFDVPFFDAPADQPAEITLTVNGITATLPISNQVTPGGGSATIFFDAALFGNPTTLDSASFTVSGPVSFDVEIDQFDYEAIPEPMTILGTGLALTLLPGLKKAHNKKKAN
ncbi:PEP-CTERM sorting domain-containing protein [Gloeocapsa sp. PCC 73106]|uniref:PEP-CTERM sorting domain-containing protein n=1 Tax=Gloeocapsa sp. PCC 73106 TaxID=102232 RepID=UPI0002ACBDE0|nr:PEP-CTERM sorting domain-containing protein [Gloeocapsa sp. PCC 73106]ELR98842.1 hypothetical protein GLO73106DRAFT_00026800 [Gloeocapsa sp. PCC 73106]